MITGKFWNIHDDDTLRRIFLAAERRILGRNVTPTEIP